MLATPWSCCAATCSAPEIKEVQETQQNCTVLYWYLTDSPCRIAVLDKDVAQLRAEAGGWCYVRSGLAARLSSNTTTFSG